MRIAGKITVALSLSLLAAAPVAAKESASYAAKVNGVEISRAQVERGARSLMAQNGMDPASASEDMKKKAEGYALGQMINLEVLYQEAKKQEIKDLDKQVDEQMKQIRERFSPEEFKQKLTDTEMTEQQLVEESRKYIMVTNLINKEVTSKVKVSEEAAKKYYEENAQQFKEPESVNVSHILVKVEQSASADERKKAKEKAEGLLKKLKEGADFAATAQKESGCPSSAKGGDLGEVRRGQTVKPFEDAAFALKPGELSGVVESDFGYHIIKTSSKKEARTIPYDEVKSKIQDYLKQTQSQKSISDYVESLKKSAKVEMAQAEPEKKAEPAKEEKKDEKKEEKKPEEKK